MAEAAEMLGITLIYSHLDSTTTVGSLRATSAMPPAASRGDLNSRAEWGWKVRESTNGKLELWVHEFGNGKRMFSFVIRA